MTTSAELILHLIGAPQPIWAQHSFARHEVFDPRGCPARVPVYDVPASVAAGISAERILAAYPGLDAEKIELATTFAQAYPPRGRPRTASSELPTGAVIVSDHRRPRRKKAK